MTSIDADNILHGAKVTTPVITESLGEFFHRRLSEHGDKVAQVIEVDGVEHSVTFAEVLMRAEVVATTLREHGIGVGGTVMLLCGNSLDYTPLLVGTLFVGAAVAPVNPSLDVDDLGHLLNVVAPQLVITNDAAWDAVTEALARHRDAVAIPCVRLATLHARYRDATRVDFHVSRVTQDLRDHVAFVMCSSGTSGRPKGVEMTQASALIQLVGLTYIRTGESETEQTVAINISGPFWITCLLVTLVSLHLAYKLVLLPVFDARRYLSTIQKYKVNFSLSSPALIYAIDKLDDVSEYDATSLRVFTCAGGPMSVPTLLQVRVKLGVALSLSYAMTEAPSVVQVMLGDANRAAAVGVPFPNVDVKVVDVETGVALPPGRQGELCFKTATLMKGYRRDEQATRDVFDAHGFLRTGDLAYFDKDGYIYIVDRLKELIKNKGQHVPAVDIEEVLMRHEQVVEAAVVGVHHETDWEHATAFVVRIPGATVTANDLVTLVQGKLSPLKWLYGGVHFLDALPKTATGKVRKRDLRNSVQNPIN